MTESNNILTEMASSKTIRDPDLIDQIKKDSLKTENKENLASQKNAKSTSLTQNQISVNGTSMTTNFTST